MDLAKHTELVKLTTITLNKIEVKYILREICLDDIYVICSWVKNQKMLSYVSGDIGDGLSPSILNKWIDNCNRKITMS